MGDYFTVKHLSLHFVQPNTKKQEIILQDNVLRQNKQSLVYISVRQHNNQQKAVKYMVFAVVIDVDLIFSWYQEKGFEIL